MAFESKDANRAGNYAQWRYRRGLRSWRATNRWLFAAFFGPIAVVGAVPLVFDLHLVAWCSGVITGVAIGGWMTLREWAPAYVANWQQGAEGERKTAKALKPLQRSGSRVFHDIQTGHGNYDHVLVGPAGVFLLETKNLGGIVEIRDGTPHLLRRHDPDVETPISRIRPTVVSAAVHLKKDIERRTGLRPWVQAVVVLWADFPEDLAEHDQCVYVHGTRLRAWLTSRPSAIGEDRVQRIADAIAALAAVAEGGWPAA